ncbi:MAG: helix-turn-helix transcriptional regulator [Gammaproteobacteria bacterium]
MRAAVAGGAKIVAFGPTGRSTRGIDYQDVPRPVAALADEYPDGYYDPPHSHRRAQLVYASAGVMSVTTPTVSVVVPPQRAVWVPPGMVHDARCRGAVSVRTLYVDASARDGSPTTCRVLEVSTLLRELIIEATQVPVEYDEAGRDGRMMQLLLDEIVSTPVAPLHIPMPDHPQLLRICQKMLADPAHKETLDDWAAAANMGRRTFTRVFRRETGMSFAAWRQHLRLMEALSRLAVGERVTSVAFDVGYNSSSAFTAMFRRTFGAAPARYFSAAKTAIQS